MDHPQKFLLVMISLVAVLSHLIQPVQAQVAAIRAGLFYSPICPHCGRVIQQVIPPLAEQHGTRLQIFAITTLHYLLASRNLRSTIHPQRAGREVKSYA